MCAEQARVMRLAGTINYKTGRYARIVQVDLSLAPYSIASSSATCQIRRARPRPSPPASDRPRASDPADPYRRIPPPDYFAMLAGVSVPRSG